MFMLPSSIPATKSDRASKQSLPVLSKSEDGADTAAMMADIDAAARIVASARAEIESLQTLNYWKLNAALAEAAAAVEEVRALSSV